MAGYHCTISCESCDQCCGLPLLPLNAKTEGFEGSRDVVEEAVFFFRYSSTQSHLCDSMRDAGPVLGNVCRANVLFTNYSIKSSADKLLVYITLFLSSCLKRECCALQLKLTSYSATEMVLQQLLSFAALQDCQTASLAGRRPRSSCSHWRMRLSVSLESLASASAVWSQHQSTNKKQVQLYIGAVSG